MRLLSYNIHKGIGGRDRRYRLERIVEVIESESPDLIFLQEVDRNVPRSRHDDQPHLLMQHFQAAGVLYQLNVRLREGGYGNLILSRWPLAEHHQISLRLNRRRPRGAQLVTVATPHGELMAVNFHLGLAERERHWQIQHLLAHPYLRQTAHLPQLIVGDFNDWRNTLHRAELANQGFQQITSPPSRFRSFPAYFALGSLDKAFFRGGITVEKAHIVRTAAARLASDHLPLVIDFHLAVPSVPEQAASV